MAQNLPSPMELGGFPAEGLPGGIKADLIAKRENVRRNFRHKLYPRLEECATSLAICVKNMKSLVDLIKEDHPVQYHPASDIIQQLPQYAAPVVRWLKWDVTTVTSEFSFAFYLNEFATLRQLYVKQGLLKLNWGPGKVTPEEILETGDAFVGYLIRIRNSLHELSELIESAWIMHTVVDVADTPILTQNQAFIVNSMMSELPKWSDLNYIIGTLLSQHSILVEQQPLQFAQVAKKTPVGQQRNRENTVSRFGVTFTLLNFGYLINVAEAQVDVHLQVISEAKAMEIYASKSVPEAFALPSLCELSSDVDPQADNNKCAIKSTMTREENGNGRVLKLHIPDLSITKLLEKRSNVAKTKYYFLVTAQFPWQGWTVKAWTFTIPFNIQTHSSQQVEASAYLSWSNYFSNDPGSPFQIKDDASWAEFSEVLQGNMREWTGLDLDEEHLECLKTKLGDAGIPLDSIPLSLVYEVKRLTVRKEGRYEGPRETTQVPWWTWFYRQANIFKQEYFNELFQRKAIMGFVSNAKAAELMMTDKTCGMFIVRCSDSTLGALSIDFIYGSGENGRVEYVLFDPDPKDDNSHKAEFLRLIHEKLVPYVENEVEVLRPAFLKVYPGNENTEKAIAFPNTGNAGDRNGRYLKSLEILRIN